MRVVPDLVHHFAQALVRTGLPDVAVPVIDSYMCGMACPADAVVAEIARRLREIIDREPRSRSDQLESLAARIALHQGGHTTRAQRPEAIAAELGVSVEDYRAAKALGDSDMPGESEKR